VECQGGADPNRNAARCLGGLRAMKTHHREPGRQSRTPPKSAEPVRPESLRS
jgi:hypothetical protein